MKSDLSIVVYIALQILFIGLIGADTYYVAPWGSDDSSGTFTKPWRTIGKAASFMTAGDSVLIRSGLYRENVYAGVSGTASDPITYANYNNEEVIVEGGEPVTGWIQDAGNRYRASVSFTPSPRFSSSRDPSGNLGGLVLQDGAKMDYAMSPSPAAVDSPGDYYMNDSAGMGPPYTIYVYLRDLGQGYDPNNYEMVLGRFRKGFDLDGGEDYQVVDGLTFRDYNDNAVHSIGSNYCQFRNLKLYSNFITGIYLTANSRSCLIERCLFWDNGHGGIELASSNRVTVSRNKFTAVDLGDGRGGNGAHMWLGPIGLYCDSCVVENNIGFKTGSGYTNNAFIYVNGSYNTVRHNSGVRFGTGGIALFDGRGNRLINNAIDCDIGVACINVFPNAVADSGQVIQFNDFYAADPTGKYRWNNIAYNSLAQWQAASGQTGNLDRVPGFVNPAGEDLHLVPGSNCIDAGTAANASAVDYDGVPRPQGAGYDIGAFEYVVVDVSEPDRSGAAASAPVMAGPVPSSRGVWIRRAPADATGRVRIFDMNGRLIAALEFGELEREIFWTGMDDAGRTVPAGAYFIVYTDDLRPVCVRRVIIVK